MLWAGSAPCSPDPSIPVTNVNQDVVATTNGEQILAWPKEDITTLIHQIEKKLPSNDRMKYVTRIKKLNWEDVKFADYTPDECRDKWLVSLKSI